ncbi:MAG: hypothetical protein K2X27_15940 [Candidatus Obscuribacterales bacterium]|nr:hypothetical protein [Candidatus Obscuribacterales bacterium]
MSRIITKPFRESHADLFESAPAYAEHYKAFMPLLIGLGKIDQCGSNILDGRIIYIGGWAEAAPGVAELFIFPSIYAERKAKSFFEHARWWVDFLKSDYRRLQCWGEDTELSKRWLSRLGFSYEGTLKNYVGEGQNMTIWGKL